jgi:hypothetical protein
VAIPVTEGWAYRCEAGAESPEVPVLLENLAQAPAHDCPKGRSDVRGTDEPENHERAGFWNRR